MDVTKATTDDLLIERARLQKRITELDQRGALRSVEESAELRESRRQLVAVKVAIKSKLFQNRIPF